MSTGKLTVIWNLVTAPRKWYYRMLVRMRCASCGKDLRVGGRTWVNRKTYLADHVRTNGLRIDGDGTVRIGQYFHSGYDCLIITQNHNYDKGDAIPYDNTYVLKDVTIEDQVWLGDRVIILGGVTIGEGAIIQAGSVVTHDIPPLSIAGGHPAEVFKMRDREHYERLKAEGKFH